MNKIGKIAVVVGLIIVVGVVIILKRNKPVSTASVPEVSPSATAVEKSGIADTPGANKSDTARSATALPRLVDLGAGECVPCKMMAPTLTELKKEYADRLRVDFIDVWKDPDAGKEYGIRMIPTQIFYDASGKELFRHEGFMSKEDILENRAK